MRKNLRLLLAISIMATSLSSFTFQIHAEQTDEDVVVIDVVHTNDIHGRSAYQRDTTVGFEKLKTWIHEQNADIVLDAGDTFHGQAFATLEQGQSIAELMKAVGYDAITPGNHDWNYGKDRLKELEDIADTPILAANVTSDGAAFFENKGYIIKDVEGVKVGVFGVFDQDIKGDTAPRNITGLQFDNDVETANALAKQLRDQDCDVVLALTHQLYLEEFTNQLHGVDAIIAGHEHAVMNEDYLDADQKPVKIVETGSYLQNAGHLSIAFDTKQDKIKSVDEELLSAKAAENITSHVSVKQTIQQIQQRQNGILMKPVGRTLVPLVGTWENLRIEETTMGRVVSNAYMDETGADIAFENAGGIRTGKTIPVGLVTYQNIIDTSPYGNYIVTKEISGAAVKNIVEESIQIGVENKVAYDEWKATGNDQVRWPDDNGSYLQFAGIQVTYDVTKPKGERIQQISVKGKALDNNQMYTVATNNYLALGKRFRVLADYPIQHQYAACDEALISFFGKGESYVANAAQTASLVMVKTEVVPEQKPTPDITPETGPSETNNTNNHGLVPTGDPTPWGSLLKLCGISGIAVTKMYSRRKQN